MDIIQSLTVIAEFSIGLSGFTGIIAIFHNTRFGVQEVVKFRILNLLILTFIPGFISLLIIGLMHLPLGHQAVIRIGSALLVITLTAGYVRALLARRHITVHSNERVSQALWTLMMGGWVLISIPQLVNLLAPVVYGDGILVLGLVVTLLLGAVQFTAVVLLIMGTPAQQAASGTPE